MSNSDENAAEIGENVSDIDQSVTVSDADEAQVEEATCPVVLSQPHPTAGNANQVW